MVELIKIQINSLEAIERLIGGNSELEIEVRNSIVKEVKNKVATVVNKLLEK